VTDAASGRFTDMHLIGARVPLLKFKDQTTKVNVDLNVHNIVGIRNTRLLKAYVECESLIYSPFAELMKLFVCLRVR
jgi:DNA polymerase sigma